MAVTVTRQRSYGSNVMNSLVGLLFAIILIPIAVGLLFWNEGRVDLSKTAKNAALYSADSSNDDLIYTVGKLQIDKALSDKSGFIYESALVYLKVYAEMYSWYEEESTVTRDKLGGGTEEVTTYTVKARWSAEPQNSEYFHEDGLPSDQRHTNPNNKITENNSYKETRVADNVTVNGLKVDAAELGLGGAALRLNLLTVVQPAYEDDVHNNYIYIASDGTYAANPTVGDIRISLYGVHNGTEGLIIGKLSNGAIVAYTAERKTAFSTRKEALFRFFNGETELNEAVTTLSVEHRVNLWVFRIVGLVLIYVGLLLIVNPIVTLLGVLPFLKRLTGGLAGIIMFPVSLVIWGAIVLLAVLLNNIISFAALLVVLVGLMALIVAKGRKKKRMAAAQAS